MVGIVKYISTDGIKSGPSISNAFSSHRLLNGTLWDSDRALIFLLKSYYVYTCRQGNP